MSVRAKFKVHKLTQFSYPVGAIGVEMSAVYETKDGVQGQACQENKIFGDATPSGSFNATIVNPEAAKQFEIGKSYYLDFHPAPE